MTALLELKVKIKEFYAKYSLYVTPLLKFAVALIMFVNINIMLGFLPILKNGFVVVMLSLLCAILPMPAAVIIGCGMVVGHCCVLGIEIAVFGVILLLLLVILYLRFAPKDALVLMLTPLAFQLNLPCAIPVGFGLKGNPGSAVSTACGVIFYYFMKTVQDKAVSFQSGEITEIATRMKILLDTLLQSPRLWLDLMAFAVVVLVVYFIRRASVDHAWTAAIVTGCILYPALLVMAGFFLNLDISVPALAVGSLITAAVMFVMEFFVFHVDYSRTEHLQYEDEDYYYYVKAVPKMKVTQQSRTVKTIRSDEETVEHQLEKS